MVVGEDYLLSFSILEFFEPVRLGLRGHKGDFVTCVLKVLFEFRDGLGQFNVIDFLSEQQF